ncbi:MAG: cytochrome c-type biogenesis protein CcmH [bacterium]
MKTRLEIYAVLVSVLLSQATVGLANDGDSNKAKSLQKELEHSLVAPCCWNMTVDQHDSQASRQVREKISELIEQKKSKEEILAYFVAQPQYGERILAAPSQDTLLGKMAYWLIPIALIFGAVVVAKTIKSFSIKKPAKPVVKAQSPTEKKNASDDDPWSKKVEDELSHLDL